jgi:hypothetical protein
MAGFVRRFTSFPSIEVLAEIEAVNIVDLPPPAPTTGVGSGTMLLVGEFEDGPFAGGGDAPEYDPNLRGIVEVFSSEDLRQKFGGFGFTYGTTPYQNPASRRHLSEFWNGSGFIKLKFMRPRRLILARADTSVGSVAFSPIAALQSAAGPFVLAAGDQLSLTTEAGGPALSTAIAAVRATILGAVFVASGYVGGEQISVQIDNGVVVVVTFAAADQTPAQVAARINLALGFTAADVSGGALRVRGLVEGTDGEVTLADVSPGALASIGHVAGSTAGTGNVGNRTAVTATEIATIINATLALTAINAAARALTNGAFRVFSTTPGSGQIEVNASAVATATGLQVGFQVDAGVHGAGTIPAGTRVRTAGGAEWVTMQTLAVAEGTTADPNPGPHVVKVRPAVDDGTGLAAAASTVNVVVDQPAWGEVVVTNPSALTAALTENQMDVAYETAFDATLDLASAARQANYSISARRSTAVVRKGRENAIDASAGGHFGRKFITGAPIGFSQSQAQADVALWRSDRLFYTWPGWRVRIPEIAFLGTAGGLGFTADGVITVRGDGPLGTLDCQLNPEENPGQQTGLIEQFFAVEPTSAPLGIQAYTALKAAGICAPRRDAVSGSIYQSGITSDVTPGLTTQARRKMADFIQDTLAQRLVPFSKKLSTQARREGIRAVQEQFLGDLESLNNPEAQRIVGYTIDPVSGNTPSLEARGIVVYITRVRTLSSLDAIVIQTEIGEGVITVTAT